MYEKYMSVLAVGAFIIDENKKLLIVKKSAHEQIDAGLWVVPGGKIYPNEHIFDGLRREVLEETGLSIFSPRWIGEDVFQHRGIPFHAEHFICKVNSPSVTLEKKLTEYKWISGLPDMELLSFPENIKKRIIEIFTKQL